MEEVLAVLAVLKVATLVPRAIFRDLMTAIRGVMEILRREVMVMDVASTEMVLVCMVPVDLNVQRSI